jgi:hypothetical protein
MHVPTSPNGAHPNGHTAIPSQPPGPDAKPPAADGGRDAHGRFGKGNAGGPGNPFARQVAALRRALLATVTEEDLEAVARALVRQAKEGNLAAAKLLLSYTLGKPAAPVDPDTLDQQEWEGYRRVPDPGQDFQALAGRMPLSFACAMMRAMLPGLDRDWTRQWADGFRQNEFEEQLEAAAREERAARRKAKAERRRQERTEAAAPQAEGGAKERRDRRRRGTGPAGTAARPGARRRRGAVSKRGRGPGRPLPGRATAVSKRGRGRPGGGAAVSKRGRIRGRAARLERSAREAQVDAAGDEADEPA